uniref:VCBS domain-containing protein n=1 Tax=Vibrio sonorensis TaxID=1004316 RepID=UPI000A69A565
MNMATLAPFLLANTTIVIDTNGQIRALLPGEIPGPGEVIVTIGQGATAATDVDVQAELVTPDGQTPLDLDNEIAAIIGAIEGGVDPTQNEDFATAAGGQQGSSPTGSGDIERTGNETIAETSFDTSGLESQGLSETQSLTLLDIVEDTITTQAIVIGDDNVAVDETDVPVVVNGTVEATDTDDPTFIPQTDVAGDNGSFSIDEDGNWTYTANSAFNELNIGDSLVDTFEITAADGTVSSVTVTINGTNDLPQFELDDEASDYSFSYSEGVAAGETVGQVSATDPDNQVLAFSISTNLQDGDNNDLYQIDPITGEISLTAEGAAAFTNDFETLENAHSIVVTVTEVDGAGTPQSVDVTVNLNELDV